MANPFSPTTTGGVAGQFVYTEIDTSGKKEVASLAESRSAKYEAEDQERVNNYTTVLEALDQDALVKIQTINNKKQEIVTIINNVYNTSGGPLVSDIGSVNDSTAAKVVYMAGISTFTYDCVGDDPPVCQVGVSGQVFPDILSAWHYPNVESLNITPEFYRQGETDIVVTNANLGIGVTAYEFGDAAGITGTIGLVTTSNSSLGSYYFYSNLSLVNPGAATSITNIVNEIEVLRNQVRNFLTGIATDPIVTGYPIVTGVTTATNKIRSLKSISQVNLWFEKKGQQIPTPTDYPGGLMSLENQNNASIIQNYNS